MTRPVSGIIAAAVLAVCAWGGPLRAQQAAPAAGAVPSVPDAILTRPVGLRTGIGHAHDPVGTDSAEAQAFYDQGLEYLHSYVWIEAARSFNQALRIDPKLVVSYAGLSLAYTELNQPERARETWERALRESRDAPGHDRLHISLRASQWTAENDPGDPAKLAAYRQALDGALEGRPGDAELWLLRGIAESPDPADRGQGSVASSIPYYEKALALAPGDDAALHYLAHAYENSGEIDRALEFGRRYADAASAVPHAQHMRGHALMRVGRVEAAVASFEAADRIDRAYLAAERIAPEFEWHYEHNLDLLGASYAYLGQMDKAERALKEAFGLPTALLVQALNKHSWPVFLVSRGRLDEARAAAATLIASPSASVRAIGHVAVGHAELAAGKYKEAADEANAALREARAEPSVGGMAMPSIVALQGEFFLRTGQTERGEAALRDVVARDRAATGPDAFMDGLFEMEAIAKAARAAGDWTFAAWVADQMMQYDPNYPGSKAAADLAARRQP